MALHVIKGTPVKPARANDPKPAALLQCRRCGGRETIESKTGVMVVNGKARGGTKSILCAGCHRKGERIVLL
jgi:hypothetical protein